MVGRLGIIGAGNMGEAIIRGVLQSALLKAEDILVTDVSVRRLEHMHSQYHVQAVTDLASLAEGADTIILAVKPSVHGGTAFSFERPAAIRRPGRFHSRGSYP